MYSEKVTGRGDSHGFGDVTAVKTQTCAVALTGTRLPKSAS